MRDELDRAISECVAPVISKREWKEVRHDASSIRASREYTADKLHIRIENDRHLLSIELGSADSPTSLRDVSLFKDLLSPPQLGRWRLSLSEGAEFIDVNWEWLKMLLSADKLKDTLEELDRISRTQ